MNNKLIVRIIAFTLAVVMLLGLFVGVVFADEPEYAGLSSYYSSAEFEAEYTYGGDDLGAT